MPRIAIGGIHHETNTFAPTPATYDDFAMADGWPGLTRGDDILAVFRNKNIGISGFLEVAQAEGWSVAPLLWCQAGPSGRPTEEAYERVAGEFIQRLRAALAEGPLDAVYLCLHGAMATEHLDDGEGELMRRVRAVVGDDIPLVASLDFHANVTPAMVALSDALAAYRTYPHLDIAATGRRAAGLLRAILASGRKPAKALRHLPYLIPLTQQCTMIEPAKGIAAAAEALGTGDGAAAADVSFAAGFPPADIADCGPSILAYGWDEAAVAEAADALEGRCLAAEADFAAKLWQPDEAVAYAIRQSNYAQRPIVLADTQDNPGAGGDSDTVGILAELVRQDAPDAVLGLLYDPATAKAAHAAGIGATLTRGIGCVAHGAPFAGSFIVEALSDGAFDATGPMYGGFHMQLGPMAVLRVAAGRRGVRVVVSSRKQQAADQAMFAQIGIDPATPKILVLKSSVHFRNHFQDLAEEILVVLAPGPNIEDPAALPYRRLREGVRLRPLGPVRRA
ncbi:MAG: M81 family metallopeptidase [Rhodospirillaceae bacterium]|nr:M81 family metallopeptidase [Rhodospirillaceae bacterium]